MDLRKKIAKELEVKKLSRQDIETKYKISKGDARRILDSYGSELRCENGEYWINRSTIRDYRIEPQHLGLQKDEKIGMIADTHMCSKYHTLAALHEYYDIAAEEGVKKVFHGGDLTDGYLLYKGQLDDLVVWGEPNQREFVVRNYPKKKGITTYIVAGNHDLHGFELGGSNVVENICKERSDLKYCGMYHARFMLNGNERPSFDILHDTKRRAYALSYPAQVRQRDTPPEDRPDMSLAGHRHVTMYAYYNNEHMFEAGCFERSSPWMAGRGIQAVIAGWLNQLDIKDDYIKKCKPELLVFK